MMESQADEFYYVTVMNENYAHQSIPPGITPQIIKGMYLLESRRSVKELHNVRLLGSGTILKEVIAAAHMLCDDFDISCDVYSVTSFSELARDARSVDRYNRLHPLEPAQTSHLSSCLPGNNPIIAATDYVRAYPEHIAAYIDAPFRALGTDGFGRSDTRGQLRSYFEVNRQHIAVAAIAELVKTGALDKSILVSALAKYNINVDRGDPWTT
jgi:pyruvate dehydrogenase E1 component